MPGDEECVPRGWLGCGTKKLQLACVIQRVIGITKVISIIPSTPCGRCSQGFIEKLLLHFSYSPDRKEPCIWQKYGIQTRNSSFGNSVSLLHLLRLFSFCLCTERYVVQTLPDSTNITNIPTMCVSTQMPMQCLIPGCGSGMMQTVLDYDPYKLSLLKRLFQSVN